MQVSRHYSLAEANGLLPTVQRVFKTVRPLHARLVAEAAKMKDDGFLPDLSGRPLRGKLPPAVAGRQRYIRQLTMAIHQLLEELTVLDITVKSAEGLVDFKSYFEGRTVYLCWRWGEERILSFHELDGGYRGRRVIADGRLFTGDEVH